MALLTTLEGTLSFNFTTTVQGATVSVAPRLSLSDSLADGTGLDQGDILWYDLSRTLGATTAEEIDLVGSLSDAFGTTISAAKLKMLYVKNTSTTAGDILAIGGAAANAAPIFADTTDIVNVGADGQFLLLDPSAAGICTLTAGTADLLKINNTGANSQNYKIAVVATSA